MNLNKSNESDTRAIRALFGKFSERTHRPTEVTVVVAPAEIARIEVRVPRVVRTDRIRRRRPVVAVRASAAEVRAVAEAGSRKEDAPICISALARNKPPVHAVLGSPCGSAIVDEVLKL